MPELNLEYTQLINKFKNEINEISTQAFQEFYKQIDFIKNSKQFNQQIIDDFEGQTNKILFDAQNHLDLKQKEFYNLIDSMSVSVSENVEEIKDIIEKKKQEALIQLNKSENSAITRLEEIYDIGVSTILSAEKTSLNNLGILTEELMEKLKNTAENVDVQIKDKLKQALSQIEEFSNSLKEEIKKTEIQIQENIKEEAKKLLTEIRLELDNIIIEMKNFSALLKKELTEHKDLMLQEIRQDKDKFFIEMDREQNRILEVLRLKEYEISVNLNRKEQAIISNIAMTVNGYEKDMEYFKQSKLNEFIDALELIYNRTLEDIVTNAEELFKSQVGRIIQEIEDAIMSDTLEATRKLLNEFGEQRYEFVLPAGETIIDLKSAKYAITNRLRLYLDGILQINKKHYTVDEVTKTITLTRSFPDDIDVTITEDMPRNDLKDVLEKSLKEIKELSNNCKDEITKLSKQSIKDIVSTRDEFKSEINELQNNSLNLLEEKKLNSLEEIKNKTNELATEYKKDLDIYVAKWKEGTFSTEVETGQTLVNVNPRKLVLNTSAKIYFDGILQIINKHYTINYLENAITILTPFTYPIDLFVLQNLPVTEDPKREATDEEIDNLFDKFYYIGTDEDIDSLFK